MRVAGELVFCPDPRRGLRQSSGCLTAGCFGEGGPGGVPETLRSLGECCRVTQTREHQANTMAHRGCHTLPIHPKLRETALASVCSCRPPLPLRCWQS